MAIDFLFATDLHGSCDKMRELVKKAIEEDIDLVILGGDLFRSGRSNTIGSQIEMLEENVQPIFERFSGEVITIFGNNDWHIVADKLKQHAPKLSSIQGREYEAGEGLKIIGSSYVPVSPFMIKDWELFERTSGPLRGARSKGLCSRTGDMRECAVEKKITIMDRLEELGDIRGKLLISHTPPRGTNCGMGYGGVDLGSSDLREFIIRKQPIGVLCGHIHESPERSGSAMDRIGDTHIGNPGSYSKELTSIRGRWDGELHMEPMETHIVK